LEGVSSKQGRLSLGVILGVEVKKRVGQEKGGTFKDVFFQKKKEG